MAKKSKIAKNEQRKEVYLRYRDKVAQLKKEGRYDELQKLPRNASRTRIRNRDSIDGRPRGYISKFGISRVKFREMANRGELPGVKKSSW
ncbi:MAG TPA: 30S ribosomal protein S14 [Acholeplasmataceae bacterium]|jgi:small subunit ribosomal protein S14|nr:30S ribosomal protein S14 [Acholeplasmataceae bacterium]